MLPDIEYLEAMEALAGELIRAICQVDPELGWFTFSLQSADEALAAGEITEWQHAICKLANSLRIRQP